MCVCVCVCVCVCRVRVNPSTCALAFTRYWYYQSCMVYRIQAGGRKGSCILSTNRAIVLYQRGQCRGRGGERMVDSCTTASK